MSYHEVYCPLHFLIMDTLAAQDCTLPSYAHCHLQRRASSTIDALCFRARYPYITGFCSLPFHSHLFSCLFLAFLMALCIHFSLILSTRLLPGSRWGSTWAFAVHTVVLYEKSSCGEGHPGSPTPHLRHLQTPGSWTLRLTGFTVNTDSPSLAASLSSRDSATRPAEPL